MTTTQVREKRKYKMVSKVRYARQGIKCRICQTWLHVGERKANQFLCCNEDSTILTNCQKRHRQIKLANETFEKNKDRPKTLVCDQCQKTIPRIDQHQKRCVSGTKDVRSECQKKAVNKLGRDYHEAHKGVEEESGKDTVKRVCLRCQELFDSDGVHNRICEDCSAANSRINVNEHKSTTIGFRFIHSQ